MSIRTSDMWHTRIRSALAAPLGGGGLVGHSNAGGSLKSRIHNSAENSDNRTEKILTKNQTNSTRTEEALRETYKRMTSKELIALSSSGELRCRFLRRLVGLAFVGGVVCSDGWAPDSIGHSGACSHHCGVSRMPHILALFAAAIIAFNVHWFRQRRAAAPNC